MVSGSGTPSDPYIIEGWVIDTSTAHGILISDADAFFVVRNCTFYGGFHDFCGIYLNNVSNGRLEDNVATNNQKGIYLLNSSFNTLTYNNCSGSMSDGISFCDYSNYNNATDNNCFSNSFSGIQIYGSDKNAITNNYVHNSPWDFYSEFSSDNIVQDLHLYCYPVDVSLTHGGDIALVGVPEGSAPPNPPPLANLSLYVNVTALSPSSPSWVLLNVSYKGKNLSWAAENSLKLYRWDESSWVPADGSGVSGVNPIEKYVYANVPEFSIFAPFYLPSPAVGGSLIS